MNQKVLYRKYRPQSWDTVYGQDHITKVLRGAVELNRVGHAYLFSGPRGTGKTSVARIFAKSLGCSDTDVIEIDAASNRGIDDIRSIKEGVLSLPFDSEKKMYIIDEVHMLTKEAFNALLKTLEEPPQHVVFVLATTEPQKVLSTIISRCQHFVFKSPNYETIKKMIQEIVDKEGFQIDKESLDIIAFLANGSFRDAQGVLQKLISYSKDNKLTRDETELVLGVPHQKILQDFIQALADKDIDTLLSLVKKASSENIDAYIFLQMFTEKIRNILKLRFSAKVLSEMKEELSSDEFDFLVTKAKGAKNINSNILSEFLQVYAEMEYAYLPYVPLELAIFRLFGNNE